MKRCFFLWFVVMGWLNCQPGSAQEVYPVSSGELLFQFSDVELQDGDIRGTPMRFSFFFHWGQYWHLNLNNHVGFYSGIAIRNVGFIYDENNPVQKTVRRSYNLGVPLMVKLGAFNRHLFILAGAEYELLFHYKGKRWYSHDRDGTKLKDSEWFSPKTERFVPSLVAGIQFPGGVNLRFKYYLDDFLNLDYVGDDFTGENVSFANFKKLDLFYISLSWQFRTDRIREVLQVSNPSIADRLR